MVSAYAAILRAPRVPRVVAAAFVGRLPIGMGALAVLLLVRDATGSYAVAGSCAAALAAGEAVGQPIQGRLIDRFGQPPSLVVAGLAFPAAAGVLAFTANLEAPAAWALLAAALAAGVALPPLMAAMRALWPRLVQRREELHMAYALEAVIQELEGLVGPLLVAGLVALGSPTLAVLATGAAGGVGALWFAASPASRAWRPDARSSHGELLRALRDGGVRTLVGGSLVLGFGGGVVQVTLPAFADREGAPGAGGLLLAAVAVGSILGGLWYGQRSRGRPERRYLLSLSCFGLGLAPLALAPSLPGIAVLAVLTGFSLAPTFASGFALVNRLAAPGTLTETFAWTSTAIVCGIALGSAVAGAIIEAGSPSAAFAAGAATTVVASALTWMRRGTLTRAPTAGTGELV
jgi:MFS family permease